MLINWLLNIFPGEMSRGWKLVRVNLGLWLTISAVTVLARHWLAMIAGPGTTGATVATLAGTVVTLLVLVATIVLLDHAARNEPASGEDIKGAFLGKALPLFAYALVTIATCSAAASLVMLGVRLLIKGTPIVDNAAAALGMLIYLSLLVRFCFFPYFTVLTDRSQAAADLAPNGSITGRAAMLVWPLVASTRISAGIRWRIAPYVALPYALRLALPAAPAAVRVPIDIAYWMLVLITQAVLLNFFRDRLGLTSSSR